MTQHLKILQDMEDALDDAYAAGIRNSKREWVGLTDEERKEIHDTWRHKACLTAWGYEEAIEAKLKEKNT
jgi:hypothetical protein